MYTSCFAFRTQKFKILPSNVECLADYISPNVDIKDTVIHFKPKEDLELLLKVPIETPDSTLVVMLGTNSSYLNTHRSTFALSVTDHHHLHTFFIIDANHYHSEPPCDPFYADTTRRLVPEGTKAPSTFKFTFLPRESFGFCETPQNDGYINVGKYTYSLNLDEPLYLEIKSTVEEQEIYISYLSIQST